MNIDRKERSMLFDVAMRDKVGFDVVLGKYKEFTDHLASEGHKLLIDIEKPENKSESAAKDGLTKLDGIYISRKFKSDQEKEGIGKFKRYQVAVKNKDDIELNFWIDSHKDKFTETFCEANEGKEVKFLYSESSYKKDAQDIVSKWIQKILNEVKEEASDTLE